MIQINKRTVERYSKRMLAMKKRTIFGRDKKGVMGFSRVLFLLCTHGVYKI